MNPPPEAPWPLAAEMPVALLAWIASTAHAASVLARRGPVGALDTLALALALALPWSLARAARLRAVPGTRLRAATPYRGDEG